MKPQLRATLQLLPVITDVLPKEMELSIRDAVYGAKITDAERSVLMALVYGNPPHAGHHRALSIATMQDRWARCGETVWNDRTVKAAVKSLLETHQIKVGSSRGELPGYFLIVNAEDARIAGAPLVAEIKSLARRCKLIGVESHYVRELLGQEVLAS